jgi:hypothetical protein
VTAREWLTGAAAGFGVTMGFFITYAAAVASVIGVVAAL